MSVDTDYTAVDSEARQRIPSVVRGLLGLTGKTTAELSKARRVSQPSLSERLTGKTGFKASEIAVMSVFFDVDESFFYSDPRYRNTTWSFESAGQALGGLNTEPSGRLLDYGFMSPHAAA